MIWVCVVDARDKATRAVCVFQLHDMSGVLGEVSLDPIFIFK